MLLLFTRQGLIMWPKLASYSNPSCLNLMHSGITEESTMPKVLTPIASSDGF